MFTGIIEELGTVQENAHDRLKIAAPLIATGAALGHSVAVNGVCLTVAAIEKIVLVFDVMGTTTTLSDVSRLKKGTRVNLERAARPDTFMGGHIVQGHVDGVGKVRSITKGTASTLMTITTSRELLSGMVALGSIAIDGVSLTIASLAGDTFTVSLIPTTLKETILGALKVGDTVNIETDIIGKYVKKYVQQSSMRGVSEDLLKKSGFIE